MKVPERYNKYVNVLVGKKEADEILDAFQNSTNKKYSSIMLENESFKILNVTKHTLGQERYDNIRELNSSFHTLYMHKEKDIVILKTSILNFDYRLSMSYKDVYNSINTCFVRLLRSSGLNKFEFTKEIKSNNQYMTTNVKILIPKEYNDDQLIELLSLIDKFNDKVNNIYLTNLDDMDKIYKSILSLRG